MLNSHNIYEIDRGMKYKSAMHFILFCIVIRSFGIVSVVSLNKLLNKQIIKNYCGTALKFSWYRISIVVAAQAKIQSDLTTPRRYLVASKFPLQWRHMDIMASQTTRKFTAYSTVFQAEIKENIKSSASLTDLCEGFPLTKGQ